MKKKVAVVSVAEAEEAARLADLPLEATVALAEVAGAIKDGLLAFASATGLVVMHQMMAAELTEAIGEKHAKIGAAERVGNWHGNAKGSVVLGGRQVKTERPRGRSTAGTEIELDTWKAFSSADLLNSLVVERMLAGVATRRHIDVAEPVGKELEARSKSMSKSAVSRRFVAATTKAHERADGPGPLGPRRGCPHDRRARRGRLVCRRVPGHHAPTGPRCRSGCGWATPRTRPWSPPCWPTWSAGVSTPSPACCASSTAPRRWRRASKRCSAMRPLYNVAYCIMQSAGLCGLPGEGPGGGTVRRELLHIIRAPRGMRGVRRAADSGQVRCRSVRFWQGPFPST